jgi:hypothetical protein
MEVICPPRATLECKIDADAVNPSLRRNDGSIANAPRIVFRMSDDDAS